MWAFLNPLSFIAEIGQTNKLRFDFLPWASFLTLIRPCAPYLPTTAFLEFLLIFSEAGCAGQPTLPHIGGHQTLFRQPFEYR